MRSHLELEEDVLEGVDEAIVPVAKLVNVPVYTDVNPNGCAADVVATTGAAVVADVDMDIEDLAEETV